MENVEMKKLKVERGNKTIELTEEEMEAAYFMMLVYFEKDWIMQRMKEAGIDIGQISDTMLEKIHDEFSEMIRDGEIGQRRWEEERDVVGIIIDKLGIGGNSMD